MLHWAIALYTYKYIYTNYCLLLLSAGNLVGDREQRVTVSLPLTTWFASATFMPLFFETNLAKANSARTQKSCAPQLHHKAWIQQANANVRPTLPTIFAMLYQGWFTLYRGWLWVSQLFDSHLRRFHHGKVVITHPNHMSNLKVRCFLCLCLCIRLE